MSCEEASPRAHSPGTGASRRPAPGRRRRRCRRLASLGRARPRSPSPHPRSSPRRPRGRSPTRCSPARSSAGPRRPPRREPGSRCPSCAARSSAPPRAWQADRLDHGLLVVGRRYSSASSCNVDLHDLSFRLFLDASVSASRASDLALARRTIERVSGAASCSITGASSQANSNVILVPPAGSASSR
jgi:hypothetical protein